MTENHVGSLFIFEKKEKKNEHARIFRTVGIAAEKNAPTILMMVGVGGSITALVMAIRETPKAQRLLAEKRLEKQELAEERGEIPEEVTIKEEAGIFLRAYWPAMATEAGAIICFLVANKIHIRRGAALAALYKASEETFRLYQDKVRDRFGEKETHEVEKSVNRQLVESKMDKNDLQIIETGHGNQLFYEKWSGRIFRSNIEEIRKQMNSFNKSLIQDNDLSLNDWYSKIDLDSTESGYRLGWCCDSVVDLVELSFDAELIGDGVAVTTIDYRPSPSYDFRGGNYR